MDALRPIDDVLFDPESLPPADEPPQDDEAVRTPERPDDQATIPTSDPSTDRPTIGGSAEADGTAEGDGLPRPTTLADDLDDSIAHDTVGTGPEEAAAEDSTISMPVEVADPSLSQRTAALGLDTRLRGMRYGMRSGGARHSLSARPAHLQVLYARRARHAHRRRRAEAFFHALWMALGVVLMLSAAIGVILFQVARAYYQSEAESLAMLARTVAAQNSLRIYDANGTLLYEAGDAGLQHSIPLANIPVSVINATVAIEDHSFWKNPGIDPTGIVRAALTDFKADHPVQGASTITQQLIKLQLLSDTQTNTRKLHEIILALGLTGNDIYDKRDVLEMYLNAVAYSPLAYGIDAAAQYYFGYADDPATGMMAAQHLDLAQASMLAGIPQNPNLNDPFIDWNRARARQRQVLNAMITYGYVTRAQADAAWAEAGQPGFLNPGEPVNLAPHFVQFVLRQLTQMSGTLLPADLSRSGLSVYTTLDLDLQQHVQQYMHNHLHGNDRDDYGGGLIRNDHLTNAAAILVDHHTGAIKVLLGSENFYDARISGSFDVATDGYRGPGSSFKPIVYATAFEKGWFPAATAADVPTTFVIPNSTEVYRPLDFNPTQFRGIVTLRHALQDSLNIPAVRVMRFAGVDNVRAMAERLGITQWAPGARWGLSSALGSLDVTLYEMVQAYTVFANYGQFIPLRAIDHIADASGNVVYQYASPILPRQVLDPRIAFLITSILSDNPSRADEFGGCSPLYLDPSPADCFAHHFDSPNAWPAAAKTGTGQDFTDDWTLGYTTDYTMGVWAGNNDHTPMYHIDGVTGSAPIWQRSMLYAERGLPKRSFPVPAGMRRANYCSFGVCTTDWFMPGRLPPPNKGSVGA